MYNRQTTKNSLFLNLEPIHEIEKSLNNSIDVEDSKIFDGDISSIHELNNSK